MSTEVVSATDPDWSREARRLGEWAPSKSLLSSIRAYQRHARATGPLRLILRYWAVLRHRFWSVLAAADIPINTTLGGGLLMPHPNGIVIHPGVTIGPNCLIFQQVTIGATSRGVPMVGGHVDFGAGAKILGPVVVGDHCVIGANAVLLEDLPAGAVAVGVPARRIDQASAHNSAEDSTIASP